jgi:glycosyltransferase involved in cell wall biosynthesis
MFGLTMALAPMGVSLDVVGGDNVDGPEMHSTSGLRFLNFRKSANAPSFASKVSSILLYYARLIKYAAADEPKIIHILWNSKFELFDRTLLMIYYKLLGKKIVLTAHNVNAGKRDSNDSRLNRLTLRIQYMLTDHIFVHTEKMKQELVRDFKIKDGAVTVIPFGINNSVPNTQLTPSQARERLGIRDNEKAILFFGALRPYKGLEYLADAFLLLAANYPEYRLIIAGERRKESGKYVDDILQKFGHDLTCGRVIQQIQYIPDNETELYFKAADVLVLPYIHVFQSGVLFLAYSFGLPVVATDVGSVRDEIVDERTGFLCKPRDPVDLARGLNRYFESDLFKSLESRRQDIRDYANAKHSWQIVGDVTRNVYSELLGVRK